MQEIQNIFGSTAFIISSGALLAGIAALVMGYLQVEAVERGSKWQHTIARRLGYALLAPSGAGYFLFIVPYLDFYNPTWTEILAVYAIALLGVYLFTGGEDKYQAARELYLNHEDPSESWTDAWLRGESNWHQGRF